jgi:hypothetical protein
MMFLFSYHYPYQNMIIDITSLQQLTLQPSPFCSFTHCFELNLERKVTLA